MDPQVAPVDEVIARCRRALADDELHLETVRSRLSTAEEQVSAAKARLHYWLNIKGLIEQ